VENGEIGNLSPNKCDQKRQFTEFISHFQPSVSSSTGVLEETLARFILVIEQNRTE